MRQAETGRRKELVLKARWEGDAGSSLLKPNLGKTRPTLLKAGVASLQHECHKWQRQLVCVAGGRLGRGQAAHSR